MRLVFKFGNFKGLWAVFKIEVFNALQVRFGLTNINLFQNNPSKRNPKLKMKTSLKFST